jgi:hypothetical protein
MWGSCKELSVDPITVQCSLIDFFATIKGYVFGRKFVTSQQLMMTYTTNVEDKTSNLWIMNEQKNHIVKKFQGIIHDIGIMATDTFFYFFVLFENDRVEIWDLSKNDITQLTRIKQFLVLDSKTLNQRHFCPRAISIPPGSSDEYDILSDCGIVGKNVHRMGITYAVDHFDVPLSMHTNTKGFCSFKDEFVIDTYSEVFSISGGDTFNKWTVPLEYMDGGFSYEMHCLPTLDKVAYTAHGTKGLSNTLIEQYKVEKSIN